MGEKGSMSWANKYEKTAEERGYTLISVYETKEEIDHVLMQIHGCGAHAFKAHHYNATLSIDLWYLWVKVEDMHLWK